MGTGDWVAPRLELDRAPGSRGRWPGRGARGRRGASAHALRRAVVRQPRRGRLVAGVRAGRRPPRVAGGWRVSGLVAAPRGWPSGGAPPVGTRVRAVPPSLALRLLRMLRTLA